MHACRAAADYVAQQVGLERTELPHRALQGTSRTLDPAEFIDQSVRDDRFSAAIGISGYRDGLRGETVISVASGRVLR